MQLGRVLIGELLPKRFEEFMFVRRECGIVLRVAVSENATEFLASFPLVENEMVRNIDAASDKSFGILFGVNDRWISG